MRNSSWFSASVEDHDAAQQENWTQSAGSANNRSVGTSEKNGGNHLLEHFGKRPIHEERPTSSSSVSIPARDSRQNAHGGGGVLPLDAHGGGGHNGRSLGGRGGSGPSEVPATFGRKFIDNSVEALHQMAPPSRQQLQHIRPRFLPTRSTQPQDAQPVVPVSCLRSRSVPPPQEHGTSSAAVAISRIERRNRSVDFADGCELIFVDQRSPSRARLHPTNEAEESVPLPTARGTEQLQRIRRGSPYSTPTPGMMLFYQRNRGSFPVARASQIVPTEHGKGAVAQLAAAPGGQWCTSLFFDCVEPDGHQAQDGGPDGPDSSREQRETGAIEGGSPDSMILTVSNACTVNGNSSSSIFSEVLTRTGALHDARAYAETDPFALPAEVGCFCLCAPQPPPRRILRMPNP